MNAMQLTLPTSSNQDLPLRTALYTAFLCFLFGGNAVAIKISLTGMGIFTTAGIRFTLASITLLIWAKATGQSLRLSRDHAKKLMILTLIFIVQLPLFYYGLSKTTASHGTLIANLLPFVVLILAHHFIPGDRITLKKLVGIALGFIGVFTLLSGHGSFLTTDPVLMGDLLICCAVFLWGCNATYVKRINSEVSVLNITFYPMAFGGPLFLLVGYFWDAQMIGTLNATIIQALLYQTFVTASYCFIAWNGLLQKFGATAVHSFIFIMPVSGVFFSVLLLGEPLTPNIVLAILMIVTGTVVVNRHTGAQPARKA